MSGGLYWGGGRSEHTSACLVILLCSGAPVYKVFASGLKWYTMWEWWEIVVYFERSRPDLVSEPIATLHTEGDVSED